MGAGGWNINNKENNSKVFGMLYFDIDHGGKIKQGRRCGVKGKCYIDGQERSKVVTFEKDAKWLLFSYLEMIYFSIKSITPFKLLWWLCNTFLYSKYKDKLRPNDSTDLKKLKSPCS